MTTQTTVYRLGPLRVSLQHGRGRVQTLELDWPYGRPPCQIILAPKGREGVAYPAELVERLAALIRLHSRRFYLVCPDHGRYDGERCAGCAPPQAPPGAADAPDPGSAPLHRAGHGARRRARRAPAGGPAHG